MTVRNKGLGNQQTLKWDSHARLAQVVGSGVSESYLYDETGQRVRKTNNLTGVSTFYPVGGYEQTGSNVTKQYSFGGRFVAVRGPSGALSFLLQDQINSTVYVLDAYSNKQASRGYYTFGATRFIEGTMPTDYHFTGQREDGTGLYYYNSRFYDPYLGNFISPDTVVPDPTKLIDYNRYLYAAGNPVKYNDPTGHQAACAAGDRWCWENRYYNAHGYFWDQNTNHWALTNNAQFADEAILDDTVLEAGVQWDSMAGFAAWTFDQKVKVATGIVKFGQNLSGGLGRIRTLVGGQATMQIGSGADYGCRGGAVPCALPVWVNVVRWPADFVDNNPLDYVAATAVHELAHVIDWQSGIRFSHAWAGRGYRDLTVYGGCQLPGCVHNWESWAESVATFVYGANYINNLSPQGPVPRGPTAAELNLQINAVQALLEGWVQP